MDSRKALKVTQAVIANRRDSDGKGGGLERSERR